MPQRLHIAAVGKARAGPLRDLFDLYTARLTAPLDLREVAEKRPLRAAELKAREADLLLGVLPARATIIALDERGKGLNSQAFAEQMDLWSTAGGGAVAFVIGGADGLGSAVLDTADARLSLGAMTWPHMLVRVLLVEQVYRAQKIRAGHPYHRE